MVDGAGRKIDAFAGVSDARVSAQIVAADADGHRRYRDFTARALVAPPQGPVFVEAWQRATGTRTVFAILMQGGTERMWLPLTIDADGLVTTARLPGDTHANASFPACEGAPPAPSELADALSQALRAVHPPVDLVLLERLDPEREGRANPLAALPGWPSPNPALSLSLAGGFEGVLLRVNGKRKRKKHRSQVRKFEEAGGYALRRAASVAEVDELLAFFFACKAAQFRRQGIADVFADPATRGFLKSLYAGALNERRPPFVLDALEVGGKLRAVAGSSICGSRIICDIAAIADDELTAASPGDFLFFENIGRACGEGFAIFDFGVGDETYKRQWCDIATEHRDVAIALTARGRLAAGSRHTLQSVKRRIKGNAALWTLLRRLRQRRSPSAQATERPDP